MVGKESQGNHYTHWEPNLPEEMEGSLPPSATSGAGAPAGAAAGAGAGAAAPPRLTPQQLLNELARGVAFQTGRVGKWGMARFYIVLGEKTKKHTKK